MCYEDFEYLRRRAEEMRKAKELSAEKQPKPAVPGKPAEADSAREQGEPVPV